VCDGGLLEGGCGLHEHATIDGGTNDKRDRSGTQDDTLKVKIGAIGDFPVVLFGTNFVVVITQYWSSNHFHHQ